MSGVHYQVIFVWYTEGQKGSKSLIFYSDSNSFSSVNWKSSP